MLKVKVIKAENYSEVQMQKINIAVNKMERVLNSEKFKTQVLTFITQGEKTFSYKKNWFSNFEKYSNEQVYQMIMNAKEAIGNINIEEVDLYLTLEPGGARSTIGFGLPTDEWIHTYQTFFDAATESELAGHFAHEWCHKIGFEHAMYAWQDKNRDSSVPYAIGDLVESLSN